jgi:hypothetical protein
MNFGIALIIAVSSGVSCFLIGFFTGLYVVYLYEKDNKESLYDFKSKEEGEN